MNKAYKRINWENYPSDATPLNEANLNNLDSATDTIDDRVITLDTTKATKTEVATLVSDVTFEESTGIITITKKNGSKFTIDTQMEKIAVNFDYNPTTEQIVLTLIDGTKQYIDLSALITQYEFLDTDTVAFTIGTDGKVSAIVKEGSIKEKHLEPNYLAKIKVEVAKDYYEQVKRVSQGINGIIPMGTVAFTDLPVSGMKNGWMYNISDDFTSDDRFNDGGGIFYGKGNNVIWTSEGKWDVTAGSGVTGIKGNKEKTYRQGNVNLTPEQIGALAEDGDTSDTTVAFASSDTPDVDASAWESVAKLTSGEKHTSLFTKVSQMFKNVRYLYKMLGSTDISSIGGGTVTGAISSQNEDLSQLNTNLADLIIQHAIISKNGTYGYIKDCIGTVCYKNKSAFFHIEGEISGVIDLFFTDFGLSQTLKTPSSIYGDVTSGQYKLLATAEDENKNILYIRVFSNNASVQLSTTAVGIYGATFAVIFA